MQRTRESGSRLRRASADRHSGARLAPARMTVRTLKTWMKVMKVTVAKAAKARGPTVTLARARGRPAFGGVLRPAAAAVTGGCL